MTEPVINSLGYICILEDDPLAAKILSDAAKRVPLVKFNGSELPKYKEGEMPPYEIGSYKSETSFGLMRFMRFAEKDLREGNPPCGYFLDLSLKKGDNEYAEKIFGEEALAKLGWEENKYAGLITCRWLADKLEEAKEEEHKKYNALKMEWHDDSKEIHRAYKLEQVVKELGEISVGRMVPGVIYFWSANEIQGGHTVAFELGARGYIPKSTSGKNFTWAADVRPVVKDALFDIRDQRAGFSHSIANEMERRKRIIKKLRGEE